MTPDLRHAEHQYVVDWRTPEGRLVHVLRNLVRTTGPIATRTYGGGEFVCRWTDAQLALERLTGTRVIWR